jgi:hypothetical protein
MWIDPPISNRERKFFQANSLVRPYPMSAPGRTGPFKAA